MTRRDDIALFLALALFIGMALLAEPATAIVQPVDAAAPCINLSSQGWWRKSGITVPTAVGQHIHMDACLPTGIVNGTIQVPVKVTGHDTTGPIVWVRACRESSVCQMWRVGSAVFGATAIGPCADCSRTLTLPINVGAWPSGTQELRLTANINDNDEGKRQFQSTGWPLHVRSITFPSCGRCNVFHEARGWYEGRGYANARVTTPLAQIRSGATIKVSLKPGSDGLPTRFAGIYANPDMHNDDPGIVIREWSGPFTGSVTLPTLPAGSRLVLISSDGANAGVLAVPVAP